MHLAFDIHIGCETVTTKIFTSNREHNPSKHDHVMAKKQNKTQSCIKTTAGKAIFFMQPK